MSALSALAANLLDEVVGGQNTTTVTTPLGSISQNQTDYGLCHQTASKYCETRPQNRTSLLGFDTGASSEKTAACMKETLPALCGTPK